MTNFVYDNTELWNNKFDVNPITVADQQWGAADALLAKNALIDLRAAVLGGAVLDVRQYGVVAGGASDSASLAANTAALQSAINASLGRPIYFQRGLYAFNAGSLVNTARSFCMVGDFGTRAANNGTELTFYGAGVAIQNGVDNGHAWSTGDYDGPQDMRIEDLWISHAAPDTTTNTGANYKAGAYGIWDWRGGGVVLRNVGIEKFEATFVGVNSDINRFYNVTSLYSKYGIYAGPRSDQFSIDGLYSFNCDRALTIDGARMVRVHRGEFVGCGNATASAIEVRQGSGQVHAKDVWFEHIGDTGYTGTDGQSCVSVGEVAGYGAGGSIQSPGGTPNTASVEGCTIRDTVAYITTSGVAGHLKWIASVGKCHRFVLQSPGTLPGNAVTNVDAFVGVQAASSPNSTDTQIAIDGILTGDLSKALQVLGGSPGFDITASGTAGRVLGAGLTAQHTINGKLTVQAVGATNPAMFVNNNVAAQAAQSVLQQVQQNGSFNTTGGFLQSIALQAQSVSTRSSGGSSLRNVGLQCTASSAQENYGLEVVNGDAQLNTGGTGVTKLNTALIGVGARAAAPSTGTHVAGEVVFNADPIAGGKVGWVCVTGGTPGTWKAFGAIDP